MRLVYYHGSKTGQNGSRAQKRSYEPLNLFLYDKPRLPAEREHNKTVNQKAEAIRAKRLLEIVGWARPDEFPPRNFQVPEQTFAYRRIGLPQHTLSGNLSHINRPTLDVDS